MDFHGLDKCYLVKKAVQVRMEQLLLIVLQTMSPELSECLIYDIYRYSSTFLGPTLPSDPYPLNFPLLPSSLPTLPHPDLPNPIL